MQKNIFTFEAIFHVCKNAVSVKISFLAAEKKEKKHILKISFQSAISKDQGVGGAQQRAGQQLKWVGKPWKELGETSENTIAVIKEVWNHQPPSQRGQWGLFLARRGTCVRTIGTQTSLTVMYNVPPTHSPARQDFSLIFNFHLLFN